LILDRIFDRDDLILVVLDFHYGAVQRRGLAAARRSGHQNHSIRLVNVTAELLDVRIRETDDFQAERPKLLTDGFLVENTDDRVLSVDGRHDGNTEIDGPPLVPHFESTVLRNTPL